MAATDEYRYPREKSPHQDALDLRQSSQQQSSNNYNDMDDKFTTRSRQGSSATGIDGANTAPPLHDTINYAVRSSDAVNQVDPSLIAHISEQVTQNVIKAIQNSGIPPVATSSPLTHQPDPIRPRHDSRSPVDSPHRKYTPPSVDGRYDSSNHSMRSSSPESTLSETPSYASHDTPSTRRRGESNASPPRTEDATRSRPRAARVDTAIPEATTLEKIWQPLFDNGRPTARLGQFLRGLAIHLIDDFEPKCSLVVTPAKMSQFFREVRQPDEVFPFVDIFGGQCTNASISRMYRGLGCQHHLIQLRTCDEPTIPGLTPYGFESWMIALIQAYPDKEFDRLAKAVLNMPISNYDSRSERFPKELPRRLFPRDEDRGVQQKLWSVISADRNIQLRSSNSMPPPPSQPPPAQSAPSNSSFMERERNPYSSTPGMSSSAGAGGSGGDEQKHSPPRVPIERERQPYTAREGTGKIFEDRDREFSRSAATRAGRSNSSAPTTSSSIPNAPTSGTSRPVDISSSSAERVHRSSVSGGMSFSGTSPPSRASAAAAGGGPSTASMYVRSEGANLNEIPPYYYSSSIPSSDTFDDDRRGSSYVGRQRTFTEDYGYTGGNTSSAGGIGHRGSVPPPPRSNTGSSAGYEYPNSRDSNIHDSLYEERRRSAYPGGNSGTDGYGSYASRGGEGSRY